MTDITTIRPAAAPTESAVVEPIFRDAMRAEMQARAQLAHARSVVARTRATLSDAEATATESEQAADEARRFLMEVWDHYRDALTRERERP